MSGSKYLFSSSDSFLSQYDFPLKRCFKFEFIKVLFKVLLLLLLLFGPSALSVTNTATADRAKAGTRLPHSHTYGQNKVSPHVLSLVEEAR